MDGFDLARARVAVVINAASGKGAAADLRGAITDALSGRCASLDWHEIPKGGNPGDLAARARDAGADVVLSVGGDGTQAAVAQALAGSDVVMAPIPTGTFNYFARDLGMGDDAATALTTLIAARPRAIDLAEVNGTVFLNNASFGLYPEILEARESLYRRWGRSRLGAYWTVLTSLTQMRRRMRLSVQDGDRLRRFKTRLAFVAASPLQLESLGLEGGEALHDGHLALFVAHGRSPWALIGAALRLAMGRAARASDFDLICADDLTIDSRPRQRKVAHDGEKSQMSGPFRLRVRPDALWVLAPERRPDGSIARGARP
ncbi:diacylglycerol kinase family protein [Paracoccus sp. p4-l81]|uniref:diacylglycerol/lipid kinase family protein n=1 Tax=Paracoccus sp. p4-l81 TaxID=3342806 RepID=UPI0035BB3CFD